jgi:hypothetical protein
VIRQSSHAGRAVEVSRGIHCDAGLRIGTIRSVAEAVQDGVGLRLGAWK